LEVIFELFWRHFPPSIHHQAHTKNIVFSRVFTCFGRFGGCNNYEISVRNSVGKVTNVTNHAQNVASNDGPGDRVGAKKRPARRALGPNGRRGVRGLLPNPKLS
jgi:hypothetical protein